MSSKIAFTSKSFQLNMEHKIQLSGLRRDASSNVSGWTKKTQNSLGVGNQEMSNVFSALAKTIVQKEHTYLAVSHIHTFYIFYIFSKQGHLF